jgi:hypothetical protein
MGNLRPLGASIFLVLVMCTWHLDSLYAQTQSKGNETSKISVGDNTVSIKANIKVQVTNETFEDKDAILQSP